MCNFWGPLITADCEGNLELTEDEVTEKITGVCLTKTSNHEPFLFHK